MDLRTLHRQKIRLGSKGKLLTGDDLVRIDQHYGLRDNYRSPYMNILPPADVPKHVAEAVTELCGQMDFLLNVLKHYELLSPKNLLTIKELYEIESQEAQEGHQQGDKPQ